MKFDDAINGALAVAVGLAIILAASGMPAIDHIDYGPGLFPTITGAGFVLAGLTLIGRRLVAGVGAVPGGVAWRGQGARSIAGVALVIGSVLAYVFVAPVLGFLLTAPVILFALVTFFTRRPGLAVAVALVGTVAFHLFFYQVMSAPLPWGVLTPYAGILTW